MSASSAKLGAYFADISPLWVDQYRSSPSFRSRLIRVGGLIDRHLVPFGRVLDYGSGPGIFSLVASSRATWVVAFDVSVPMLTSGVATRGKAVEIVTGAGWKPNSERISLVAGGLGSIRTSNPRFDLVLAIAVLEYVSDPPAAIRSLIDLLRPGGTLIMTVPEEHSILRRVEHPVNWMATRVGQFIGSGHVLRRQYSILRPPQAKPGWWLGLGPSVEVLDQVPLPLGETGWRLKMTPSLAVVLRRPLTVLRGGSCNDLNKEILFDG